MAQIRITPEDLVAGSNFLKQKVEILNQAADDIKKKIDEVTENWEGAAKNIFFESFERDMQPFIKQTLPEIVLALSDQLSGAATALKQADEETAKAFKG